MRAEEEWVCPSSGKLIETDTSQIWSPWLFHLLEAPWKAFFTLDEPWLSTAVRAHPSVHSQWALGTAWSTLTLLPFFSTCHSSGLPSLSIPCIYGSLSILRSPSLLTVQNCTHIAQVTRGRRMTLCVVQHLVTYQRSLASVNYTFTWVYCILSQRKTLKST